MDSFKICNELSYWQMRKVGIQGFLIKYIIGDSNGFVLMTNYLYKLNTQQGVIPTLVEIMAD